MPLELYIHIPFCLKKCNYCDFLSFPMREEAVLFCYMDALYREIRETAAFCGSAIPVRSIFIGGGTPSILPLECIERLLRVLGDHFGIDENTEISIEANPGTLTREKLVEYRKSGINRLSIGLQSPDDKLLARLGRIHSWKDFQDNYTLAREAGFTNINIDLMSGLPGQTVEGYAEGIGKVLSLKPDHISSYSLILEEGTPFYKDPFIRADLPDEEKDRIMYHETRAILLEAGYHRYEISNYALPGKECIHNLGYWSGVPYLGLGLGASSLWKEGKREFPSRFANVRNLENYMKRPFTPFDQRPEYEILREKDCVEEFMFLGLRKMSGISIREFDETFSESMDETYGEVIDKYCKMGLMERKKGFLRLTEKGIDVSDYIFSDFIL